MPTKARRNLFTFAVGAIFVLSAAWQTSSAQTQTAASQSAYSSTSVIIPPYSELFPLTYGEWGARWWQYVMGIQHVRMVVPHHVAARPKS